MEQTFRYCPWCAAAPATEDHGALPSTPAIADSDGRLLRISRYLGDREDERHVRLSVWQDLGSERTRTEAAISIDEAEAGRLASFLRESEPQPQAPRCASRLRRLGTLL